MGHGICSLEDILNLRRKSKKKYHIQHAISILSNILDGLIASKSIFICHRDIKPDNILLYIDENKNIIY